MIDTFRILFVADLSARASRGPGASGEDVASRRRWRVDRDTFDDVLLAIAPKLRVAVPGSGVMELSFRALEDFRPEGLVERIPAAGALRDLRARLADSTRFAAARAEARSVLGRVAGDPSPPPATPERGSGGDLLMEDLLAGAERQRAERKHDWRAQVLAAIAPELADATVPGQTAEQRAWVDAADAALGGLLAAVLHAPGFQALEAAWLSVRLLVRKLETSEDLTLSVIDARADEVGGIAALLAEREDGSARWALVVVDGVFAATPTSVESLRRLAEAARAGDTVVVAGAAPGAAGDAAGAAAWRAFRAEPAAASIALVSPRVLLRLPYGSETDPVDGFAFEELADGFDSASLLWGNGAVMFACALGVGYTRDPADPCGSAEPELDDLPSFVRDGDDERVFQPPAELVVGPDQAVAIADDGVMPIVCAPHDTAVRLRALFPLAGPGKGFAGSWA